MMNKKALTLLEILIAALILALVVGGLANVFMVGKRYILHSRSRMTAGELTKKFLDPLQMQVRQDEWNSNCLGNNNCTNTLWTTPDGIIYNGAYATANVSAGPSANDVVRRATVTITWNENPPQ